MNEEMFPSEPVELPSKGLLYPKSSPLASGTVDIKYMTAKEEDILTSTNLRDKGLVFDRLMESLIVTKGVKLSDILITDVNALSIAARILAYGKNYEASMYCPSCSDMFEFVADLTELKSQEMGVEPNAVGEFDYEFGPTTITFKLLTMRDEKDIIEEVKALQKLEGIDRTKSVRLKHSITAINGDRTQKTIREFVDHMRVGDVIKFREYIEKVAPGIDFGINVTCTRCQTEVSGVLPLGANFFSPNS